jgi:4-aminobutyrate aminotransferase-like enzyme
VAERGAAWAASFEAFRDLPGVEAVRGLGMLWGMELATSDGAPDRARAFALVKTALRRGVILLSGGDAHNVLQFMPPYCIATSQWETALDILRTALDETAAVRT